MMNNMEAEEPIRIPTGSTPAGGKRKTPPMFVITSSASPTKQTAPVPVKHFQYQLSSDPETMSSHYIATGNKLNQQTNGKPASTNRHSVLPAIGSTYNQPQTGDVIEMTAAYNTPQQHDYHMTNGHHQSVAPGLTSPYNHLPKSQPGHHTTSIVFQTPQPSNLHAQNRIPYQLTQNPLPQLNKEYQQPGDQHHHMSSYDRQPHSTSCSCCGRRIHVVNTQPYEHSNVQQWLVNPAHPYHISSTSASPQVPPNQGIPPVVIALPADIKRRHNIPIRYMEAPTHQVTNKSGKLLTPEDALKRTLKSKKIPPLTKRNSLRSIFSDASSNLEKIAEEFDEQNDNDNSNNPDGTATKSKKQDGTNNIVIEIPSQGLATESGSMAAVADTAKKFSQNNQARANYALLCRLVVDVGSATLVSVFNKIYTAISLTENLNKPQVQKTLRKLRVQGVLKDEYWQRLYPPNNELVSSQKFGTTLLLILLKTICHLSPPYPNGWNDLPLPSDKGLSADLARLSWYRRHIAGLETLREDDFLSLWLHMTKSFIRLAGELSATLIKKVQREVQSYETQEYYIQALMTSQDEERALVENERHRDRLQSQTKKQPSRKSTVMSLNVVSPYPSVRYNGLRPRGPESKTRSSVSKNTWDIKEVQHTSLPSPPSLPPSLSLPPASPHSPPSLPPSHPFSAVSFMIPGWRNLKETKTISPGMSQEDRNTLLVSYQAVVECVQADTCVEYLISTRAISREDRNLIYSSGRLPHDHIKALLELLPTKPSHSYQEFVMAIESKYPQVAKTIRRSHKMICKSETLKSSDVRNVLKDRMREMYKKEFGQFCPYFWDNSIVTDIRSHCVQLDITDLKGRRYPIERLFADQVQSHKVLVEGQRVSGNSMYCQKIVYDWSRGDNFQKFDFVILIDLNLLTLSLADAIFDQMSRQDNELGLSRDEVWSVICSCQRKVLLILDVYDPSADIDPEVLSLLKGDILEECSILMTCHQEQTTLLSSYFDRRLVNLGLDSAKQEQLIRRFSLLNHDSAEHYAPLVSSTLHSMDKEYEWMMKSPEALGLLCHLTRNEEAYERVATITLLYKSALLLYPFLYCLKNGLSYDPDDPPEEPEKDLEALRSLAFETVLETPRTRIASELMESKYQRLRKLPADIIRRKSVTTANQKRQSVYFFKSKSLQEFLAAWKLAQLPPEEFDLYSDRLMTDPSLHRVCVHFTGCKRHDYDQATNSQLLKFYTRMATVPQPDPTNQKFENHRLKLECVNESVCRADALRVLGESLPKTISIAPQPLISTQAIKGFARILSTEFSQVKQLNIKVDASTFYYLHQLESLALSVRTNQTINHLHITYSSTDLLANFLLNAMKAYGGCLQVLRCECRVPPSEKLSASVYTDLKGAISSLYQISDFQLVGCKNSVVLKNVIRNLPRNLQTITFRNCIVDSIAALDLTTYLDGTSTLHTLNLSGCELVDGATSMSLFKGLRINRSLSELNLSSANLNTQSMKALCDALKFNRHLKTLDLCSMELSTQACTSLAGLFTSNQCLTAVRLTQSLVSTDGLKILNDSVKPEVKLIDVPAH